MSVYWRPTELSFSCLFELYTALQQHVCLKLTGGIPANRVPRWKSKLNRAVDTVVIETITAVFTIQMSEFC